MRMLCILLLISISGNLSACNHSNGNSVQVSQVENSKSSLKTDSMKLKITVGEKVLTAILNANPTTKDFISLLPLTLTLTDYNGTEKISDLPKKLSTRNAPAGYKPSVGDITLYAPWGNLAIFYKDFSYSSGLIVLGKIDTGIDALKVPGSVNVKMELIQ
ncbi:MAG: hypothetical protein JWQ09_1421 [Segetibacter sp.]|nr:hypothetical protein [Segetibacter sp.]